MTLPKIYTHPFLSTSSNNKQRRERILSALSPHLPTSLSLYRRIQFEHFTSTSVLFSSLNLDSDDGKKNRDGEAAAAAAEEEEEGEGGGGGKSRDESWIAAYVDRSRRPETEVWMFGSWESRQGRNNEADAEEAKGLIRALVCEIERTTTAAAAAAATGDVAGVTDEVKSESLRNSQGSITIGSASSDSVAAPAAAAAPAVSAKIRSSATAVERGEYEGHLANPNIILFGSLHERTVRLMNQMGLLSREFAVGADIPYKKYLFDQRGNGDDNDSQSDGLPDDMTWEQVQPSHFSLVRSRTQIPRQDRTLRQLPSLAIFPKDNSDPIAWSFLGPDASLSSLHVEPAYRRRGFAKTLAGKLFVDGMEAYWHGEEPKDYWAHADVALDNVASNSVCNGLGGTTSFNVYWVRVDMGNAHKLD